MRSPAETFEFDPPDFTRVLARMEQMASSRTGWVNIQPAVAPEKLSPTIGLGALFGRRSPQLTLATWTASEELRKGITPESVGLQHSRPHRIRAMLGDADVPIPTDWHIVQDAPRRGFVALLPEEVDHRAVLEWLLEATKTVSPIELTGRWRAMIHWSQPERGRRPSRI